MANSIKIDLGIDTKSTLRAIENLNKTLSSLEKTTAQLNRSFATIESSKVANSMRTVEASYRKVEQVNKDLVKSNEKTGRSFEITAAAATSLAVPVGTALVTSYGKYQSSAKAVASVTALVAEKFKGALTVGSQVGQTTRQLGVTVGKFSKTFFGFVDVLGLASVGLVALGRSLERSDNNFKRLSGTVLLVAGLISGGLAFAITKVIFLVGDLANKAGTRLVASFEKTAETFAKNNRTAVVFTKTIENFSMVTSVAIGTTETWAKQVESISKSFNFSRDAVRKSGQEIIAVTSQMGFNQEQMESLLKVSAEYAAFNQKDLFDTTVKVVSALNGNAQAVQALGIKLNEASLQQFLFAKGSTENFRTLSDGEKVQVRYNKLLKSYKQVAGLGAAASATLAGQNDRLKINVENLNTALGRGAAIIENNNLVAAALNVVLDNVSDSVISAAGFLGALGARVLQVTGLFLKWSFGIFAVIKGVSLLNIALSGELTQTLFRLPLASLIRNTLQYIPLLNLLIPGVDALAKRFTFLNKSITGLIKGSGAAFVDLSTVKNVLKTAASSLTAQLKNLFAIMLGLEGKSLGLVNILKGSFLRVLLGLKVAAIGLAKVFAVLFSPITLVIGGVVGAIALVGSAMKLVQERTGVLTTVFNVLKQSFLAGASVFSPVVSLFKSMKEEVTELASKAFGALVAGVAKASSAFLNLIKLNPFGIFSNDQLAQIESANMKLQGLSKELQVAGFDVRKLKDDTQRAVAGINDSFQKIDLEALAALREEFKDFGKSQVQILNETFQKRKALLDGALAQEQLTETQHLELLNKVRRDFEERKIQAIKDANEREKRLAEERRNSALNAAFQQSQDKINFLLQDFEQEKIIQDELNQQRKDREMIISNEAFMQLQANLGRERALKEVQAAQDLARAGKTSEAIKKIRAAQAESEKNSLASLFDFEKNTNAGRAANFKSTLGTISTLSQQNNSALFNIGKAAAISTATIDGYAAVQKALASAPPPFNFALAALVGTATGANIAKIASSKPPQKFAEGGFVGGNSFSGDRVPALVNSDEFIANRSQQRNILSAVANGSLNDVNGEGAVAEIRALREEMAGQPIIVQVEGKTLAVAMRDQIRRNNFRLAT